MTDPPPGTAPHGRPPGSRPPGDVGEEPDPRFTFANERTFLAWNRTALALVSAGVAAAAFLRKELGDARLLVALPLLVLGGGLSLFSYRRWEALERAMRLRRPIPYSRVPRLLGFAIAALSAVAGVVVVVDLVGR